MKYAPIFDSILSGQPLKRLSERDRKRGYLYKKKLQKEWDRHSKNILLTMSEISGLKWTQDEIDVYVSQFSTWSFSHPLTVRVFENRYRRIVNLIHELSHVLFWDINTHYYKIKKDHKILRKYFKENNIIGIHIPVEALVLLTVKKVFKKDWQKYIDAEMTWAKKRTKRAKIYRRAWEGMEKEEAERVLKLTIKRK